MKLSQLSEDEQLARQLQRQESAGLQWPRQPRGSGLPNLLSSFACNLQFRCVLQSSPNPLRFLLIWLGGSPEELRARLQEILQMMPANDRHRPLVQRLHDQLAIVRTACLLDCLHRIVSLPMDLFSSAQLPYLPPNAFDRNFLVRCFSLAICMVNCCLFSCAESAASGSTNVSKRRATCEREFALKS